MTLKLNGSSSGSVSLDAPASTAGGADRTLTLPDKTATMSPRMVLEDFASPCDGSTIATINGDVTFPNVTATVDTTTSFTDVAGSVITYTPPTGATTVIYEFNFSLGAADSHGISHWIGFIGGTEIAYQKFSISANNLLEGVYHYKLVIPIGGSTSTDTGRQATWTSGKELKLQVRNYGASYDMHLYGNNYWQPAGNIFRQPNIHIKALG